MTEAPHWETCCPIRQDGLHCNCWYDGEKCCACGDNTQPENDMNEQLTFSTALLFLKEGRKIQRAGWNGKNMFVAMVTPLKGDGMTEPYLYITTPTGQRVPWVTSQMDVLAEDWQVLE